MEYFGDKLRALRLGKNLTQNDLAMRVGLGAPSISMYEKNQQYPSIEVLIQLCQIFDVSADYLLGFSDNKAFNMSALTDEQFNALKEKE